MLAARGLISQGIRGRANLWSFTAYLLARRSLRVLAMTSKDMPWERRRVISSTRVFATTTSPGRKVQGRAVSRVGLKLISSHFWSQVLKV